MTILLGLSSTDYQALLVIAGAGLFCVLASGFRARCRGKNCCSKLFAERRGKPYVKSTKTGPPQEVWRMETTKSIIREGEVEPSSAEHLVEKVRYTVKRITTYWAVDSSCRYGCGRWTVELPPTTEEVERRIGT